MCRSSQQTEEMSWWGRCDQDVQCGGPLYKQW